MDRPRLVPLALAALALGACGEGERQGVAVTEADPVEAIAPPGPPRPAAFDPAPTDSGLSAEFGGDSLLTAPPGADSMDSEPVPVPVAPDFRAFWPVFQDAVREEAVAEHVRFGDDGVARDRFEALHPEAFGEPFRSRILALTARDFRIRGAGREVSVTVGYDAAGEVVPEDEAVAEASVVLRFEPRDGAYRLVGLEVAG